MISSIFLNGSTGDVTDPTYARRQHVRKLPPFSLLLRASSSLIPLALPLQNTREARCWRNRPIRIDGFCRIARERTQTKVPPDLGDPLFVVFEQALRGNS